MIQEQEIQELETVPADAIPYDAYGGDWQNQGNIMSMRWENKQLIEQLWRGLAYRVVKTYNGKPYLVQEANTKPPINSEGAKAVINLIVSVVNTVGSLSQIHQEQALTLLKHIKQAARRLVIVNRYEYECDKRVQKQQVLQIVENICFLQLMRAVDGHESNQSRTNLMEKRGEESYTMQNKGGGMQFPWNKGE